MDSRKLDRLFDVIGELVLSAFRNIAPLATPVAPAFFFGSAVFGSALSMLQEMARPFQIANWLLAIIALAVSLCAALAYESFNFLAGHVALKSWHSGNRGRAYIAIALMGMYLIIGITTIVLVDVGTFTAKVSIASLFVIGTMIYFSLSMTDQIRHESRQAQHLIDSTAAAAEKQEEAEFSLRQNQLAWEQQQAERQAERQYQLDLARADTDRQARLAQVEANRQARIAKASVPQPVATVTIPQPISQGEFIRNAVREQQLAHVMEHANGSEFGWQNVANMLNQKRGTAYAVIQYGEQQGKIQPVGRNMYRVNHD